MDAKGATLGAKDMLDTVGMPLQPPRPATAQQAYRTPPASTPSIATTATV
jgi:hypothetical protein